MWFQSRVPGLTVQQHLQSAVVIKVLQDLSVWLEAAS